MELPMNIKVNIIDFRFLPLVNHHFSLKKKQTIRPIKKKKICNFSIVSSCWLRLRKNSEDCFKINLHLSSNVYEIKEFDLFNCSVWFCFAFKRNCSKCLPFCCLPSCLHVHFMRLLKVISSVQQSIFLTSSKIFCFKCILWEIFLAWHCFSSSPAGRSPGGFNLVHVESSWLPVTRWPHCWGCCWGWQDLQSPV